jgi:hypothetical protein
MPDGNQYSKERDTAGASRRTEFAQEMLARKIKIEADFVDQLCKSNPLAGNAKG